jgi:hypothetical protein
LEPTPSTLLSRPSRALDVIRSSVAVALAQRSVLSVRREIGVSATALTNFVNGGIPSRRTREKLGAWYRETGRAPTPDITTDGVAIAVDLLLTGVPPEALDEGRRRLWTAIRDVYASTKVPLPSWLNPQRTT